MSDAVRSLILERQARGSTPNDRDDGHHLVLAVEGGGMRGAVSSGMLLALEQLGMRDCFDAVVGTSAGAIAGAFFAIGQGTKGSVLYYRVLNSDRFVDRRRLLRKGIVLDIDYLVGEAMDEHGFDWDALVESDVPVWATVSPAEPGQAPRLHRLDGDAAECRAILAASASLPVVSGPNRLVDGVACVDGGLLEPVPWVSAVGLGATHVLVARSRDFIRTGEPELPNILERAAVPRVVRRINGEHVAELVNRSPERFWMNTESLRAVIDGEADPIGPRQAPVEIAAVVPAPHIDLPDRLELDTHVLMDALSGGAEAMLGWLDLEGFTVEQRVLINHPRAPVGRIRTDVLAPIVSTRRSKPRPD